jgi:hypothetical protein
MEGTNEPNEEVANEEEEPEIVNEVVEHRHRQPRQPRQPRQHIHTFTLPIEMLQGFMNIPMDLGNTMEDDDVNYIDNPLEQSITNQSFHEGPKYKNVASKDFINSLSVQKVSQDMIDKKITCGICLDELVVGEDVIELPCSQNHYFHIKKDDCDGIYPWLQENNTCPLCRHEFESEEKEVIEEAEPPEIRPIRMPSLQNIRSMVHQVIDEEEERMLQEVLYESLSK